MMNCVVADTNHVVFVQRGERGVKVNPLGAEGVVGGGGGRRKFNNIKI